MDHLKLYESIINKGKTESRKKGDGGYYENHHIYPKSWCDGELEYLKKDKRNLVLLTAREHYIAHYLLAKEYGEGSLWASFWMMSSIGGNKLQDRNYVVNSKLYERGRKEFSKHISKIRSSNTEEFITKAIRIHGNFYDYSNTVYVNSSYHKVIITCPIHGDFEQLPYNHLSNRGCVKCGRTRCSVFNKGKRLSAEHKQKLSDAKQGRYNGAKNPFYGKTHTDETKQKISETKRARSCA